MLRTHRFQINAIRMSRGSSQASFTGFPGDGHTQSGLRSSGLHIKWNTGGLRQLSESTAYVDKQGLHSGAPHFGASFSNFLSPTRMPRTVMGLQREPRQGALSPNWDPWAQTAIHIIPLQSPLRLSTLTWGWLDTLRNNVTYTHKVKGWAPVAGGGTRKQTSPASWHDSFFHAIAELLELCQHANFG